MRKGHRKSRFGCKVCRERKIKCDETRPSCHRCAIAGRTCIYTRPALSQINGAAPPACLSPSTTTQRRDGLVIAPALGTHPASVDAGRDASAGLPENYSLLHLELLHHFSHDLRAVAERDHPDIDRIFGLVYHEAFQAPFLMDEMLALAAAHKSLAVPDHAESYRVEATKLQTRSLSTFNSTRITDTESNAVRCFAFSSLLCQHVLFDIFSVSSTPDVPTTLERVIQVIELNHGIRHVCQKSWALVHQLIYDKDFVTNRAIVAGLSELPVGSECRDLFLRLESSDASPSTKDGCGEAVKFLQYIFDSLKASPSTRAIVVQEWPIRVPVRYIALLRERRPEALIVLAHYGVILHQAREYWAIGDSGKTLIHSISRHLGPYWEEWLAWPMQKLEES